MEQSSSGWHAYPSRKEARRWGRPATTAREPWPRWLTMKPALFIDEEIGSIAVTANRAKLFVQ